MNLVSSDWAALVLNDVPNELSVVKSSAPAHQLTKAFGRGARTKVRATRIGSQLLKRAQAVVIGL